MAESNPPALNVTDKVKFFGKLGKASFWNAVGGKVSMLSTFSYRLVCQVHFPTSSSKKTKKKQIYLQKEKICSWRCKSLTSFSFLNFNDLEFSVEMNSEDKHDRKQDLKFVQIINVLCKLSVLSIFFIQRRTMSVSVCNAACQPKTQEDLEDTKFAK